VACVMISRYLCSKLLISQESFVRANFTDYIPEFGGHISDYRTAMKIMAVRDWLNIYLPVDSSIFKADYPYVQEIVFPIPMKIFENSELLNEFLIWCYEGSYRGLKSFFGGLNMEFHHVNLEEEVIIYLTKDFHKGYHSLLHANFKEGGGLGLNQRNNYNKNRKIFLKFIGDALLYVAIVMGKKVKIKIKELYFADPKLENYTYEYVISGQYGCTVHNFVYTTFGPI
jgi:hypothetical protein